MKIKIKIGENETTFLVLDIEHAAAAAILLANAKLYEREGYGASATLKRVTEGLSLEFIADRTLEPVDPEVIEARKEAEKQRSEWAVEYRARQKAEGELSAAKAALAALQAVTVCQTVQSPPADAEVVDADEADDLL
jgi:hypothetical protein